MIILDARWTPKVIELKLDCDCGHEFWVMSDKSWVVCPGCGVRVSMHDIKGMGGIKYG